MGTIGKLDIGKLSASAAQKIAKEPWSFMKGKRKLGRLRLVCQQTHGLKFEIDFASQQPTDENLIEIAGKHFKKAKTV